MLLAVSTLGSASQDERDSTPFTQALGVAERELEAGHLDRAKHWIDRALERDAKSPGAWALRARWAEASGDLDDRVYALHRRYRLAMAQGLDKAEAGALRKELTEVDPLARDLLELHGLFLEKLWKVAERYEKEARPHSAIRIHKEILALDPDHAPSQEAIERLASAPDPSLAEFAKPRDLFADVSDEWIDAFDAEHGEWDTRAHHEGNNYDTYTDAGYRTLLLAAEAMEQMNAFYREFFQYGTAEDGKAVPRIDLNIFKDRDEYLKLGIGPPVEWSGGHFTGNAVETYVTGGDPGGVYGTLFHEAAHQFVSLATNAAGWLNEGLASFFEGCRILPNGTVQMNLPADHRLFPLVARMEQGWMSSYDDGLDPEDPNATPTTAPTFRIVLENKYAWGPPWYAPTWGVVYFLYNYQDPIDGRFVYRAAFREFINTSGGRRGDGAIANFEEVVLANPKPPIRGVERPKDAADVALPKNCEELDAVWKDWMLALRDERSGRSEVLRPYADWARFAILDKDFVVAKEHFEKALIADSNDAQALLDFARLLSDEFQNPDRASNLVLSALAQLEQAEEIDERAVRDAERFLAKLDPKRKTLDKVHRELWSATENLVQRYAAVELDSMVMHLSWSFGTELEVPGLFQYYEDAVRRSGGKSLALYRLAYDESSLDGWSVAGPSAFEPDGVQLRAKKGVYAEDGFDYEILTLDEVSSGDFSLEARIQAERGEVNFCGLVFGRKGGSDFHALILFPGKPGRGEEARSGFLDLTTFHGAGDFKIWRHDPVETSNPAERAGTTQAADSHLLRIDVNGTNVDYWFDGELRGTQAFASRDVLAGSLGLVIGPGEASFRDVRYLSRHPKDPAGSIEREVRIEQLREASGGAVGGSYLGLVPPFPRVDRWLSEDQPEGWELEGPAPQLLALWSIGQNEQIAIDGWLRYLAERGAQVGLRVISVCSANDAEALEDYLVEHPMPGAVGLDSREPGSTGIGNTFDDFFLMRFGMPRLLLIDIDGKVIWEGDPGFERGKAWTESMRSYLDDPFDELVARRRLVELAEWRERFLGEGLDALRSGDMERALPILVACRDFEGTGMPVVDRAKRMLEALEGAIDGLEGTCASVAREGAEPALTLLVEWAPLLEREIDRRTQKELKSFLDGRAQSFWEKATRATSRYLNVVKPGNEAERAAELLRGLESLEGRFVEELRAEVAEAIAAGDWVELGRVALDAPRRPTQWLVGEYFRW